MTDKCPNHQFYGTTTVGERGQIVIPCQARNECGFKPGDKLLVFRIGEGMLAITKLGNVAAFAKGLERKLASIREVLQQTKKT